MTKDKNAFGTTSLRAQEAVQELGWGSPAVGGVGCVERGVVPPEGVLGSLVELQVCSGARPRRGCCPRW